MRNWNNINRLYEQLLQDSYPQPDEEGRTEITKSIVDSAPILDMKTILDLGCGEGYAADLFPNKFYTGVTISKEDAAKGISKGRNILVEDFNFSEPVYPFDLIFSSHSLEHSPFPLITLMVWKELGKNLLLISPNPDHYGYVGRDHFAVMPAPQLRWLLRRAGWKVTWKIETATDLAFLCENVPVLGSEGWASSLTEEIYRSDKENL